MATKRRKVALLLSFPGKYCSHGYITISLIRYDSEGTLCVTYVAEGCPPYPYESWASQWGTSDRSAVKTT
ncbi:uncharacterized protein METZ01_LOCUS311595, partial [marine metagenome]